MKYGAILAFLTAGSLLAGTSGAAFAQGPGHHGHGPHFRDLNSARVAAAVDELALQGVINGTSNTTFDPSGTLTRGQLAAFLVRYLGDQEQAQDLGYSGLGRFNDKGSVGATFAGDLSLAVKKGILSGNASGDLNAHGDATRAQVVAVLLRALGLSSEAQATPTTDLAHFSDAGRISTVFRHDMALAYRLGLIEGTEAGELKPDVDVTRAQLALMLARAENMFGQASHTSQTVVVSGLVVAVSQTASTSGSEAVSGSITLMQPDGSTIAYGVAANADVFAHHAVSQLSQVKVGDRVVLVLDKDQNAILVRDLAARIGPVAQSQEVRGTVVSFSGGTLVMQAEGHMGPQPEDQEDQGDGHGQNGQGQAQPPQAGQILKFTVGASVPITYQGQAVSSSEIVPGDIVTVDESQGQALAIKIAREALTTPLTGTFIYGQGSWMIIKDSSGHYYRVHTSAQTIVTMNGQPLQGHDWLQVLKPGETVAVQGTIAGDSSQVQAVTITISPASTTPPTTTGSLATPAASEVTGGITLTWQAPSTAPASYQVLASANGGAYTSVTAGNGGTPAASATSTTVTGLNAGTSYTFELETEDASGTVTATSSPSTAVTYGAKEMSAAYSAAVAAKAATGSVLFTAVPATAGSTVSVDGATFTFVASGASADANTFTTAAQLAAAINANATTSAAVTASVPATNNNEVLITAKTAGAAGNSIALATTDASSFTLSGATLSGGADGTPGTVAINFSGPIQSNATLSEFTLSGLSGATFGSGATGLRSSSGTTYTVTLGSGANVEGATVTPSGLTDTVGNPVVGSVTIP